jgi:metal-responsive CopG/Arc/MetJ family transcriptional regulator
MNTSIHIPKEISDRLNTYLKHHKISKNKLIVKAIGDFLDKQEQTQWHEDLLNWQGVPGVEFDLEVDRDFLLSCREDIF